LHRHAAHARDVQEVAVHHHTDIPEHHTELFQGVDRWVSLSTVAYLIAAILFILALRGLSSQETARRGNLYGIVGMAIAIAATLALTAGGTHPLVAAAVIVASIIGATMALRVGMTAMPEMVALLHSFVGLAAVLV